MVYRLNLQEQGRAAAATEAIMPKLWILYYVLLVFSMSIRVRPIGRVIRLSFIPFSTGIRSLQCCCRGSVLAGYSSTMFFAIVCCSLSSVPIWTGSSSSSVSRFRRRDRRLKPPEAKARILPRLRPSFQHPIPKEIYSTSIVVWFFLNRPCLRESLGDECSVCKPFPAPKPKLSRLSMNPKAI